MRKTILKASAGTGKTYRLSLEYIASLLKGESYNSILVMTFTKKATSEIGKRIVDFLSILASKDGDSELQRKKQELIDSIKGLYPDLEIKEDDIFQKYRVISANIDNLKIYTIDSFIGKIFKNAVAPSLGIGKYNIINDDEDEEILGRLLESIMKNRESFKIFQTFFLENFEKDVSKYLETLKEIIDSRWKYIVLQESGINLEKNKIVKNQMEDATVLIDELLISIKKVVELKGKGNEEIEKFIGSSFKEYLKCTTEEEKNRFYTENLKVFLEKNIWDGRYLRKCKKTEDIFLELDAISDGIRKDTVIESYNNEILTFQNTVLDFIKKLYEEYDNLKVKEWKFSFNDISMYTLQHFKEEKLNLVSQGRITKYFEDIFDGKFSTFFIDEFQDTSILQWRLLKEIAEKAENVLCVGDEKQSLYGWRGGEKELFENLSVILGGDEKELDTCYRSKKTVTDYINRLFSKVSSLYEDIEKEVEGNISWNFTEVKSKKIDDSYVKIISIESDVESEDETEVDADSQEDKKEIKIEKQAACEIVKILKDNFKGIYRGCAVIAATGKELEAVAEELSNANIPYTLKSKNNIFNHRANITIFKVLKFLVYNNLFSLLELLRTDLIRANGKELKWIVKNKKSVMGYINNNPDELDGYSKEISQLNSGLIGNIIEKLKKLKESYNIYNGKPENISLEIFAIFSGLDVYNSSTDMKNSHRLFEVLKMFNTIGELVTEAEVNPGNDLFAQVSMEELNAVTLITIHSSKGLEYETVFYVHNSSKRKDNYSRPNFLLDLDEKFEKANNFIIFKHAHRKILESFGKHLGDNQYNFIKKYKLKDEQEKINGWYVALTRAITNLFIIAKIDKTEDKKLTENKLLNIALSGMEDEVGKFSAPDNLAAEDNKVDIDEVEKILDFRPLEIDEQRLKENEEILNAEFKSFSLEKEERKKIGTAVHYYCENFIHSEEAEMENAKNKTLREFGHVIGYEKLENILNSEELKKSIEDNREIFSNQWDKIYSEYEIVDEYGQLKRIDRMMIKNHTENQLGEIFIVDYKTGDIDSQIEKYTEQVEEYKEIINSLLKAKELDGKYNIRTKIIALKWSEG